MDRKAHWDQIYTTKAPADVSWYQAYPRLSVVLIENAGVGLDSHIIDVGGGTSTLADALLDRHYRHITVLDISPAALALAQERLAERSGEVTWLEADITQTSLPSVEYDVWHDRAVFHFLTAESNRQRYLAELHRALKPGGHIIIAAFAPDGPRECSGLSTVRYSPATIQSELGRDYTLIETVSDAHRTPRGAVQEFLYYRFVRRPGSLQGNG